MVVQFGNATSSTQKLSTGVQQGCVVVQSQQPPAKCQQDLGDDVGLLKISGKGHAYIHTQLGFKTGIATFPIMAPPTGSQAKIVAY